MCPANLVFPSNAMATATGSVAARGGASLGLSCDQDPSPACGHPNGATQTQDKLRATRPFATADSALFLLSPRSGAAPFGMESR